MWTYVLYFFQLLYLTLGSVVICGLAVALCEWLFRFFLGGKVGDVIIRITSVVGTPVHELGHAVMCLLFGHKITDMKLWQPRSPGGTLGYVSHSYNPKNPYKQLGNFFIGIGPVFSGLSVLSLVLWLCFPETLDAYLTASANMVQAGESGMALFFEGMKMLPHLFEELGEETVIPVWGKVIAVIVMLSVSLHISLSPADIKGALRAIPLYLVLMLLVTVVTALPGSGVMATVIGALQLFSAYLTSLFIIVLVFSLIQVALAAVVWIIGTMILRK